MAKPAPAQRRPVKEGERFANKAVLVETCPPASRTSLRATPSGAEAFEKALGFKLPQKPGETSGKAGKHALWIGPDEWLLIDEKNVDETMVPKLPNKGFSAVDVSHRNTAFIVSGEGAVNTLNTACPRDLSLEAFPLNTCSRTIFGKAEVVLLRIKKDTFRVECWRSYAPYVWTFLQEGAKDAHL